jgi:hypothetical protein
VARRLALKWRLCTPVITVTVSFAHTVFTYMQTVPLHYWTTLFKHSFCSTDKARNMSKADVTVTFVVCFLLAFSCEGATFEYYSRVIFAQAHTLHNYFCLLKCITYKKHELISKALKELFSQTWHLLYSIDNAWSSASITLVSAHTWIGIQKYYGSLMLILVPNEWFKWVFVPIQHVKRKKPNRNTSATMHTQRSQQCLLSSEYRCLCKASASASLLPRNLVTRRSNIFLEFTQTYWCFYLTDIWYTWL